ncbi:MAG: F0F1 ATP synthase subunit gamma [Alphaproteobacteria bacterium]|nr:F0F1 ATP synthase subunit gamma [Alphaproteobacteria bacterium]
MKRGDALQAHVTSMGELRDIVGAMRSLAGMRIQEAHRVVPAVRRYAAATVDAVATALLLIGDADPAPSHNPGPGAIVLCAAEHGFVGGFNERLVDVAQRARGRGDVLFIVGSRGAAIAAERGLRAAWWSPMATRPVATLETIRRLTTELYRHVTAGGVARIEVIYSKYRQGTVPTIERQRLLPLDPAVLAPSQTAAPPLHNLAPPVLLEKLMAEYVFARLTEAAVESIASENAARFSAMEAAHENVSKKLDHLRQQARQARQEEVTTELLDVITGAEALMGRGPALARPRTSGSGFPPARSDAR